MTFRSTPDWCSLILVATLATTLVFGEDPDPCEVSGDLLGATEDFAIEDSEGCCDCAPDPSDWDWEQTTIVNIWLECADDSADPPCTITAIRGPSEGGMPGEDLVPDPDPTFNSFTHVGGLDGIEVDTEGDCETCCLRIEYSIACCPFDEGDPAPFPCCFCGEGEEEAGACTEPDCDLCEELDCESGKDQTEGEGGYFGDPGSECPKTRNSVDLHRGHKRENEVDVRIAMPGQDFTITRSYSSDPAFHSNGLVGEKWTLSSLSHLRFDNQQNPCDGVLRGDGGRNIPLPGGAQCPHDTAIPVPGPTDHYWIKTSILLSDKHLPVWKLVEPGGSTHVFIRSNEGVEVSHLDWHQIDSSAPYPEGLLYQVLDEYGNLQEFSYIMVGSTPRLDEINLQSADESPLGTVSFEWTSHWHPKSRGKVASIAVTRGSTEIAEVHYTYMDRWEVINVDDKYSASLGRQGDLIQVEYREPVGENEWRERVTQYRYHSGSSVPGGSSFDWSGDMHQLKMVLKPEQIEFALAEGLIAQAEDLLLLDDEHIFVSTETRVVDLAAKIIEKYEVGTEGRVLVQYLHTDCGCSGGSGLSKRMLYDRYTWGTDGMTTRVSEQVLDGGDWVDYRIHYYETELLGEDPGLEVPYLITHAVTDDAKQDFWVRHYLYDANRNRTHEFTPTAIESYVPHDEQSPGITLSDSTGLVRHFAYNADNRVIMTGVSEGFDPELDPAPEPTVISEYEYGETPGATWDSVTLDDEVNVRPHLVTRIVRYPSETEEEVTEFLYGFYTDTDAIAWRRTSVRAEGTGENGPGGWLVSYELYDELGNNIWSKAADGVLTRREFDASSRLIEIERNASNTIDSGHPLNTSGSAWDGRFADGGSLTSTYHRDAQGRILQRTSPDGVTTYTHRDMRFVGGGSFKYYAEVSLPHEIDEGLYSGPATITWFNAADQVVARYEYLVDGYTFDSGVLTSFDLDSVVAKQEHRRNLAGLVEETKVWSWLGSSSQFHVTKYFYDALGRLDFIISPTGTVTRNTYDIFDRVIQQEVGVEDNDSPSDMSVISEYFYDHTLDGSTPVQGVGNGHLTLVRQHVSDSEHRDTNYVYDYRGRRSFVENPAAPHEMVVYDNLDRVIEQATFADVPADLTDIDDASRGSLMITDYSERGLVWRRRVAIDPDPNASEGFLETHTWYDEVGRAVGQWGPNSPMTKTSYDGLGRPMVVYTMPGPGSLESHSEVYNSSTHKAVVSANTIIEQVEYRYIHDSQDAVIGEGKLDLVTTRRRLHDATGTGALSTSNAITTFTGTDYDAAGRPVRSLNFGAGDGSILTTAAQAPSVTAATASTPQVFDDTDAIVTVTTYDDRGRVEEVTDPEEIITRYVYDDLGRRIAVIENFDSPGGLTVSWGSGQWSFGGITLGDDENRITSYVYDGNGNLIKQLAHRPGSPPQAQVTTYNYGVSMSDDIESEITSNDLLKEIIYPAGQASSTEADRTVTFAYNRQGEVINMVDQNGTGHLYHRDDLGRVFRDIVSMPQNPEPHLDYTVRNIETSYDDLGRVEEVLSTNSMFEVLNAVKFTYTPLGQVEQIIQEHDGAITGQSAAVEYIYTTQAAASGNFSRMSRLVYPETGTIVYSYGSSGSIDHGISRVRSISEYDPMIFPTPTFVAYDYIGSGMTAVVDYSDIDVQLDRTPAADGEREAGEYPGYDRFGRVIRHMWVDGNFEPHATESHPNIPPIYELTHTYDNASNRLTRHNETATLAWSHSAADFAYDGLHRLVEAEYGTARTDEWSLDVLGNWKQAKTPGPDGVYIEDVREHSDANELLERLLDGLVSGYDPGGDPSPGPQSEFPMKYDKNGNLISQMVPTAFSDEVGGDYVLITYSYDAWNRLVAINYDETPRAEYDYNGLNWRIAKRAGTWQIMPEHGGIGSPPAEPLDQERRMFYSANWQLLEEHIEDNRDGESAFDAGRHMQYVWGTRYIDDIVVRRQDSNLNGTLDKTWYHITDTLFSTVAILDDTANLIERVSYDAYGNARHHRAGDLDGDGATTVGDLLILQNGVNWGNFGIGDLNRDGTVDSDDSNLLLASFGPALPAGRISSTGGTDNIIGYAGYVFNDEIHGSALYTVRHRHYSPELGRWLTRDPLGYVDGMGLYEYVRSNAVGFSDASGLAASCGNRLRDRLPPAPAECRHVQDTAIERCCKKDPCNAWSCARDFLKGRMPACVRQIPIPPQKRPDNFRLPRESCEFGDCWLNCMSRFAHPATIAACGLSVPLPYGKRYLPGIPNRGLGGTTPHTTIPSYCEFITGGCKGPLKGLRRVGGLKGTLYNPGCTYLLGLSGGCALTCGFDPCSY